MLAKFGLVLAMTICAVTATHDDAFHSALHARTENL
jgi:hypothetical protein